eukprot:6429765-Pyramimonas_sp.AAC.2
MALTPTGRWVIPRIVITPRGCWGRSRSPHTVDAAAVAVAQYSTGSSDSEGRCAHSPLQFVTTELSTTDLPRRW